MTRAAVWLLVALALGGCKRPPTPDGEARPTATSTSASRSDAPPQFAKHRLEEHFAKHGAEMGIATKEEYLARAQALVRGGPGVDTLTQRDGDTCFFKEATGEFAVLSDKRLLRTYFKPSDGRRYFERQRDR